MNANFALHLSGGARITRAHRQKYYALCPLPRTNKTAK